MLSSNCGKADSITQIQAMTKIRCSTHSLYPFPANKVSTKLLERPLTTLKENRSNILDYQNIKS